MKIKHLLIIFGISFTIRFALLIWIHSLDTPLFLDETNYYARAVAFCGIVKDWVIHHKIEPDSFNRFYGGGKWPPLHSMILSIGISSFNDDLFGARLMCTLLSALTSLLVFMITRQFFDNKAAALASIIHCIHPSFLFFSFSLWSETTFLFFYGLSVYFLLALFKENPDCTKWRYAVLAGLALGLSGLSRASVLPLAVVMGFLLLLNRNTGYKKIVPACIFVASFIVIVAPWIYALYIHEHKIIPLSTSGGFNMYLGNNPWVPIGLGSSWQHEPSMANVLHMISKHTTDVSDSADSVALNLALEEIKGNPVSAVRRAFERLGLLFLPDYFFIRHILHLVIVPLPIAFAGIIMVIILIFHLFFCFFAGAYLVGGTLHSNVRRLFIILIASNILAPSISIVMPRMQLPLFLLLCPIIGHGMSCASITLKRFLFGIIICVISVTPLWFNHQNILTYYLKPSSYYRPLIGRFMKNNYGMSDNFEIKAEIEGTSVELVLDAKGSILSTTGKQMEKSDLVLPGKIEICSSGETGAISILIRDLKTGVIGRFDDVIRSDRWNSWKVDMTGAYYCRWIGPDKFGAECYTSDK